jgi:hypothetical protein
MHVTLEEQVVELGAGLADSEVLSVVQTYTCRLMDPSYGRGFSLPGRSRLSQRYTYKTFFDLVIRRRVLAQLSQVFLGHFMA